MACLPSMCYILFFLLIILKLKIRNVEQIIILLGITYIILYSICFLIYPKTIVKINESYGDERGFQRIIIDGIGFLFLFAFYSLSKFLFTRKFLWFIVYIISCIFIMMTLTRTLIIISFLLSFIYILKRSNFKTRIVAVFITGFSFYLIMQLNVYKLLVAETNSQAKFANEDVRTRAFNYYLFNFSPNTITKIFGNGQPYKKTQYENSVKYLEGTLGFYTSDIGYMGLYIKFGLFAILAYIILIYTTIRIPVSDKFQYCKYFLYFIFIISLIIDAPFNNGFIPSIVIASYILAIDAKEKRSGVIIEKLI